MFLPGTWKQTELGNNLTQMHCRVITIIACLSLIQCNEKLADSADPGDHIDYGIQKARFRGEWGVGEMFYHNGLMLNEDGSFQFEEGGCTHTSYSKGSWTFDGNFIFLTSFDQYKANPPGLVIETDVDDAYDQTDVDDDDPANPQGVYL